MNTPYPDDSDDFGRQFWLFVVDGFRKGHLAEVWFKWMEWALITGGIYAVGVAAKSQLLIIVGVLSGYIAMQHAIYRFEETAKHLASFVQPKQRLIRYVIIGLLSLVALGILVLVSYTFQMAIEQSEVLKQRS
jgi:hypothetical protein